MSPVLIGVTTSRKLNNQGRPILFVMEAYTRALVQVGAIPLLIPCGLPQSLLIQTLPRLDGILFTGGGDIHPGSYGSQAHPLVDEIDDDRDRVELSLLQAAVQRELPFLGICRGLQLINVGLGGSLYEDILDQRPESLQHSQPPEQPRDRLAHTVQVEPKSLLGSILEVESTQVNSIHHQAVRELAPLLRATACAPDGVVEGVELPGHRFGLGVQWHPEWLADRPETTRLFRAFVNAAGRQTGKSEE